VSRLADLTAEMDTLDFRFRFERQDVHLDVKAKFHPLSEEYVDQWPEVPPDELFVLDETTFRTLVWAEGMGYLLIVDEPLGRWHVFGPWELCLGPRRRFERRGDRGSGEFLKGKLLLDLRASASSTPKLDLDRLLDVVRASRTALHQLRAVPVRSQDDLPVIPRPTRRPSPPAVPPEPAGVVEADLVGEDANRDWAGLSASLVSAVRRRWGWREPTPVQRRAWPAVLAGRNVLVLAPTAGGKTEAALLALLDLHRRHGWGQGRPSILAISPLKALLDDQLDRWRRATALVDATAFAWHGDVGGDARRSFKDDPADALLTTPESLELLLSSSSHDEERLFAGLRAVVVDEVHAFVGTPRGAQLASLLERLGRFVDADLQRVGLSATVANPREVLGWLAGGSLRESEVVTGGSPMQGEDVSVRTYAGTEDSLAVIAGAAQGHRCLVFARSRRRAEELAHLLSVPVHHSSVSGEDRAQTLRRFRSGSIDTVIATAGLEMGMDIGDLDLVINDGAPTSPSSYLQRLGRTGRQAGSRRRLVFTTAEVDDLLLLLGVLARVRRSDLDPVDPRRGARLVLGQQALAATIQSFIADRHQLRETLRWSPTFAGLEVDIDLTIDHLLAGRWLHLDGGRLLLGPQGQARFGGPRGLSDLLATFSSHAGARVVTEDGRPIGTVDWDQVYGDGGEHRSRGLVLNGRAWAVVGVDRRQGVVTVRPGQQGTPPSWRGPMVEVQRATWEAVREVLAGTEVAVELDDRACQWLDAARAQWAPRLATPVREGGGATVIDSFCGLQVNGGVLSALGLGGKAEGATCEIPAPLPAVAERARRLLDDLDAVLDAEARRLAPRIRVNHPDLVAPAVRLAEAREHHVDGDGFGRFLALVSEASWPT
jgi:ATP-dependent Lhr-like helicase